MYLFSITYSTCDTRDTIDQWHTQRIGKPYTKLPNIKNRPLLGAAYHHYPSNHQCPVRPDATSHFHGLNKFFTLFAITAALVGCGVQLLTSRNEPPFLQGPHISSRPNGTYTIASYITNIIKSLMQLYYDLCYTFLTINS